MAREQSSFAISAAFCSRATMVRPDSSATTSGCCPFGVGANGTTVAALSGAYALITTHSITANVGYRGECTTAFISRLRKFRQRARRRSAEDECSKRNQALQTCMAAFARANARTLCGARQDTSQVTNVQQ